MPDAQASELTETTGASREQLLRNGPFASGGTSAAGVSQWRKAIIKILVLLHAAVGIDWQSPPAGTSLKTLNEAEEQGFIEIRGEFQKRQFRLTKRGSDHVALDRRRLAARKL